MASALQFCTQWRFCHREEEEQGASTSAQNQLNHGLPKKTRERDITWRHFFDLSRCHFIVIVNAVDTAAFVVVALYCQMRQFVADFRLEIEMTPPLPFCQIERERCFVQGDGEREIRALSAEKLVIALSLCSFADVCSHVRFNFLLFPLPRALRRPMLLWRRKCWK